MKNVILLCTVIALFLTGNTARAETCQLELRGGIGDWEGPCKDGKAHGKGVARLPSGTYEGEARDGHADGQGEWRQNDGGRYRGGFRDGKEHGYGESRDAEGDWYEGQFADGKPNGQGTGGSSEGVTYTGTWRDGEPEGQSESAAAPGREAARAPGAATGDVSARAASRPQRCKLEANGEFLDWSGPCKDGKAHGNGQATASDGVTYRGSAQGGKPSGHGTLTSAGGQLLYQGEFQNGFPHGRGTVLGEDGKYYVSEFEAGHEVGERSAMQRVDGAATGVARPASTAGGDEGGVEDDSNYGKALEALDGEDGVVHVAIPDDEYGAKLTELERREAERRATKEARKAERFAEETKRKIDEEFAAKQRAAFEAERKRRDERLLQMGIKARQRILGLEGTQSPSGSSSGENLQRALKKTMRQIERFNRQRERQRREYERQREREWQRKTTPGGSSRGRGRLGTSCAGDIAGCNRF